MRPTKIAYRPVTPSSFNSVLSVVGLKRSTSTPFRIVTTLVGLTFGYAARTSARMPSLTAMMASADS